MGPHHENNQRSEVSDSIRIPSSSSFHDFDEDLNLSLKNKITQAVKDPFAKIPTGLAQNYLAYQNKRNRLFLFQINILSQLIYLSYIFADYYVMPDVSIYSLILRSAGAGIVFFVTLYLYKNNYSIELLDKMIPISAIIGIWLWFELLKVSLTPDMISYQYASLIFVLLTNLSIQLHFRTALITSIIISLIIFWQIFHINHENIHPVIIYCFSYIPILFFSLYISWNLILKSRQNFLHDLLDELNNISLDRLAHTDMLTNLNNRRQFKRLAQSVLDNVVQQYQPTCLFLFDIDHFKKVNDSYGHDFGDEVLKQISHIAKAHLRQNDILARFGGEEFIGLLNDTTLEQAQQIIQRLIEHIAAYPLQTRDDQQVFVTISVGIVAYQEQQSNLEIMVRHADDALYAAKHHGRNQLMVYKPLQQAI